MVGAPKSFRHSEAFHTLPLYITPHQLMHYSPLIQRAKLTLAVQEVYLVNTAVRITPKTERARTQR